MAMATLFAIVDLTAGEIMIILVFGLMVLGPDRLPEVARTLGEWFAKARKMTGNLQAEMRDVLDDPAMQPLKDVGEFVAQPRKKLTQLAVAAEAEAAAAAAAATKESAPALGAAAAPPVDDEVPLETDAAVETDGALVPEPEPEPALVPEPDDALESDAVPEPELTASPALGSVTTVESDTVS